MRAIVVIGSLLLSSGAFANVPKHEPLPQQELQSSLRGTWRPVMAPLAHVRFCMQNPMQCERRSVSIRKRGVRLTSVRMRELETVTRSVNAAIIATPDSDDVGGDKWNLFPVRGDCDDYAVSKRAKLLEMGWPSSALLLTQLSHSAKEAHLVLTVRTSQGDFVLDNLSNRVIPHRQVLAKIERMQSSVDPNTWMTTRPVRKELVAQQQVRTRQQFAAR